MPASGALLAGPQERIAAVPPRTREGRSGVGPEGSERLLGRDFLLLWQGQLGNQAFLVATMSWTLEATGSPGLMGLLLMASTLPAVVVGPIAGAMAERHSLRALIVAAGRCPRA
jgi:hypothetical protein